MHLVRRAFRSVGVSPAFLHCIEIHKPAGETPALQNNFGELELRGIRIVIQVRAQPSLHDSQIHSFATAVIFDLAAIDFSDGKIF
jgi:hypothetical protein